MAEVVDRYTYRVAWSEEEQEFMGLCSEFALLSHFDETPEKALAGIRDLVAFSKSTGYVRKASRYRNRYPPGSTAGQLRSAFRPRLTGR